MIKLTDVYFRYGRRTIIDSVSVSIPDGRLTALVGPNGAGKSTLLGLASRLLEPAGGRITVDDLDLATSPQRSIAQRLAVLRQDNHIAARLSVADLVRFGRFPHCRGRLKRRDHDAVDQALDHLGLQDLRDRYLDQLSGGQRQRAFIAMALAQDTQYLLLDEPLNNLDPRHSSDIMRLLRRITDDLGRTVVVVVHDLAAAAVFADHVIAMREGAVVACGPVGEVMTGAVLSEVFDVEVTVTPVDGHPHVAYLRRANICDQPVLSPAG